MQYLMRLPEVGLAKEDYSMIQIANMNNKDANSLAYVQSEVQVNNVLNIHTAQRKCRGFNIQSWMFTPSSIVCVM